MAVRGVLNRHGGIEKHTHTRTRTHAHARMYTHMHEHMFMHAHTTSPAHECAHVHVHTHTQFSVFSQECWWPLLFLPFLPSVLSQATLLVLCIFALEGRASAHESALVNHEVWPRPNTFPVWLHFHILTLIAPPPFLRTHWDLGAHGTVFNTAPSLQPGESCSLERWEPDSCSSYFPPNVLSVT